MPRQPQPDAVPPRKIDHRLHLALTILSCGFYLPAWIGIAIASRNKSKVE
ncbi:hypothetical protein [Kribbella turkmenica]|nr:hypothetical protein [Kribbella turkmenica]